MPEFIEFDETPKPRQRPTVRLDLKFPQLGLPEDIAKQLRASAAQSVKAQSVDALAVDAQSSEYVSETEDSAEQPLDVVQTYLAGMAEFHNNLMGMQEEVMRAYLMAQQQEALNGDCESEFVDGSANEFGYAAGYAAADGFGYGATNEQVQLPPFLRNGLVRCELSEQDAEAELFVTLDNHRYLLDHAIGGNVSCAASGAERVYLLPLTVAVEAMSEIASLLIPGRPVLRVSSVRAARRIRVGREGCTLRLRAKKIDSYTFETSIDQIGSEQYAGPSMSCRVEFGEYYPSAPLLTNSIAEARTATLTPPELYQRNTMFHGPRMQSVVALHSLGKRAGDGYVVARPAQDWFPDDNDPKFLLDPLLLDNSTQIVLFYLFEEKEDVSALLPFLVESLELFTDLSNLRGTFRVSAHLSSMTSRGTEGDVFIVDNNNVVLA